MENASIFEKKKNMDVRGCVIHRGIDAISKMVYKGQLASF